MQGAPRRQVKAEDMLAELKRALESSTHTSDAPPPSASTAPKSSSPGRKTGRSQIDRERDRPVQAKANNPVAPRTGLQKSIRPSSRSWKLIGGGFGLAAAAAVGVSFALIGKPSNPPERELSVAAVEDPVRQQTSESSSSPQAPMQDSHEAAPLQAGKSETQPDARKAPVIGSSLSAAEKAAVDAPNLASSGLETAPPAFAPLPLNQPATLVATHRIGPDGAPIATAPSSHASTGSTPPLAQTPKPAVPTAAPQMVKPDKASLATAPSTPASSDAASPLAGTPKPAAPTAAPQMVKLDKASVATAHTPASTDSAPPLAEASKPAAPTAAPQMVKPDKASLATAPSTPASTDAAPPRPQTPKPNATQTASVSNESAEPSKPKVDSKRKPPEKISQQKPAKIAKASATHIPPEPPPTKLAPPKEAESPTRPPQDAVSPTAAAPAPKTSVQQRMADGVSHAFGYLIHLPGALVPHLGGPNPDAH
jgi:hypothetical protein